MKGHHGAREINPGFFGISTSEYNGFEHILGDADNDNESGDSELRFQMPQDSVFEDGRLKIGHKDTLTYVRIEDASLPEIERQVRYTCKARYESGPLVVREESFHPFSDGVYAITLQTNDNPPEFVGLLNVSTIIAGWYALAKEDGLPITVDPNQKLRYTNLRCSFENPDAFLAFYETEVGNAPLSTYNVQVVPPDGLTPWPE